jgi:DNA-binding MarR family transcriptional regulator
VFGIKQSTLTSVLDRLETADFIRRTLNPDDRRSFLIHITDTGRTVAEQANQRLKVLEANIRARVSIRDVKGFEAVMRAVGDVAQVRLRER